MTTYHPHHHLLQDLVKNNWDMLGRSTITSTLHKKKLVCGYRRPKNLRDKLTKAKVEPKPGDELLNPFITVQETPITAPNPTTSSSTQKTMFDYFTKAHNQTPTIAIPIAKPTPNPKLISKKE